MSKNTDLPEERRNQILDAAMETFAKLGFHKARMSDIAERSGLSKGSLYWYFDSKDTLILKLLERVFEPELKDMRSLLTDQRSTEQRLEIYFERVGDDMIKMLKWLPLFYDFIALAFHQEKIKNAISFFYQQSTEILVALIQQGLDSGELQANNAHEAAVAIGSIIEGTAILYLYDPEHIDVKTHINSSARLLLNGLRIPTPMISNTK